MYKRLLSFSLGLLFLMSCGGENTSNTDVNEADAAVIEQEDSTAKAMDDLQTEIEAKRAELEELVDEIEGEKTEGE